MPPVKRRILCAESHEDICELITLLLEEKGYEVRTTQTATDCLKLATTERFDLYLLNDKYIDGDSIELCQQLRAYDPATPVLLFSLDSSGINRRRGLQAGAQAYLVKTTDFVALVQTIDRLLGSY